MSEIINYGWLTNFDDKKFAPKSLFDYIYVSAADGRNLTRYLSDLETTLDNRDLQVDLASDNSVKFSSPGSIGVKGILDVPNGGTGLSSLTKNAILLGSGTSAVALVHATEGFLVCDSTSNQPHYAGITGRWNNPDSASKGPELWLSFSSAKINQYITETMPLASSKEAGAISTGAQEINGSKTFLLKTYFSSDVDISGKGRVESDLTITSGNLVFGNSSCVLGQQYTDKFFINDVNNNTIFYADASGLHAVEFYIKNSETKEDTNFSTALSRITNLEGRCFDLETGLAQEVADRGSAITNLNTSIQDSILYVALGTASKTTKFSNSAIGVNGTLATTNGGTGKASWAENHLVYTSAANTLSEFEAGTVGDVLMSGGSASAPYWHTPSTGSDKNTLMLRDGDGAVAVNSLIIDSRAPAIQFTQTSYNYLVAPSDGSIALCCASTNAMASSSLIATSSGVHPGANNTFTLGASNYKWSNVYATTFTGKMSNAITVNGTSYDGSSAIDVGTITVPYGGTGKTSLDSGKALIGNGTSAVTLRSITNNTTATAVTASTNLITANTLYYHKGNSNIVTVGTISNGTWNGSTIGVGYGGTGKTSWTAYGLLYASSASALSQIGTGASGQYLRSGGSSAAPAWSSAIVIQTSAPSSYVAGQMWLA